MTLISNRDNLLVGDRVYAKDDRIETTEERGRRLLESKAARPVLDLPASIPAAVRAEIETARAAAAPETAEAPHAAPQRAGRGR